MDSWPCPNCRAVIRDPALAQVGQRDVTVTCHKCGHVLRFKRGASRAPAERVLLKR